MKKIIFIIFVVFVLFFLECSVVVDAESVSENFEFIEVNNISCEIVDDCVVFNFIVLDVELSYSGKMYYIYDIQSFTNKYFLVGDDVKTNVEDIYILNFEIERNIPENNLCLQNKYLAGKDVLKIALYIKNEIYYYEGEINIYINEISKSLIYLSKDDVSKKNIIDRIYECNSWYMYTSESILSEEIVNNGIMLLNANSPVLGSNLDSTDRSVINSIGANKFATENFTYGFKSSLDSGGRSSISSGYIIRTNYWPAGTNDTITHCIYFSVNAVTPTENSGAIELGYATLQLTMVAIRSYQYIESTNEINLYGGNINYRLYDIKLAIDCAKYQTDTYDYIWKREIYKNSSQLSNNKIALTIAKQFDKYGIISFPEEISDSYNSNDSGDNISIDTWPADFNLHYTYVSNSKRANTMVRGVRVDTDDLFNEEGDTLYLSAWVVDRDYQNSTSNILIEKAIRYALKYELRVKGSLGFIFGGDVVGEYGKEFYRVYKR